MYMQEHDDNAVIMLTGNKEDLASPYREVPGEAALKVARVGPNMMICGYMFEHTSRTTMTHLEAACAPNLHEISSTDGF